ncbi:MAG: hypothetical protein BWY11_01241 [Firmicutes bacterium ADurb.Bin182]|nr:MAG: hypothetical protein BWY11_01241 [Firmicutes bacterium ADurb.Bin182]
MNGSRMMKRSFFKIALMAAMVLFMFMLPSRASEAKENIAPATVSAGIDAFEKKRATLESFRHATAVGNIIIMIYSIYRNSSAR